MRDGRLATRISRRSALLVAAATAACLAACGLDWSFQPGNGADGGSTGASSGSASGGSSGSSGGADGGEDAAPTGPTCRVNGDCAVGLLCHFSDHLCGKGQPGHCRALRTGCNSSSPDVCSCDGNIDNDECAANGRGQDTSVNSACGPSPIAFGCGDVYCLNAQPAFQEFCVRRGGTAAPTYTCENSFAFGCAEAWCADAGCDQHGCTCSTIPGGAMLDCP